MEKKSQAQKIRETYSSWRLNEGQDVCEMSKIVPKHTSLTRPLWVDDLCEDRNIPHSPYRIRVQARKGEPFNPRTNSVCIYFDKDEPYIKPKNAEHDMSGRELKQIMGFIKEHRDLLYKFYTHKDEYDIVWLIEEISKRQNNNQKKGQ